MGNELQRQTGSAVNTDEIFQKKAWWGHGQNESVVKNLMEASKEDLTNILRSTFDSDKQIITYMLALSHYEKNGDTRHKNDLMRIIVARAAKHGRARLEGLMGATGIVSPDIVLEYMESKVGKKERKAMNEDIDRQRQLRGNVQSQQGGYGGPNV